MNEVDPKRRTDFKKEQIAKVDMRKIDLTEAFDDPKIDISERLERITNKLEGGLTR